MLPMIRMGHAPEGGSVYMEQSHDAKVGNLVYVIVRGVVTIGQGVGKQPRARGLRPDPPSLAIGADRTMLGAGSVFGLVECLLDVPHLEGVVAASDTTFLSECLARSRRLRLTDVPAALSYDDYSSLAQLDVTDSITDATNELIFGSCVQRFSAYQVPLWSAIPQSEWSKLAHNAELFVVRTRAGEACACTAQPNDDGRSRPPAAGGPGHGARRRRRAGPGLRHGVLRGGRVFNAAPQPQRQRRRRAVSIGAASRQADRGHRGGPHDRGPAGG
jgi:hypothetical protein